MATNPMQRQARTSFLLGMVITLIITGAVIALLFMKVRSLNQEIKARELSKVQVYVLNQNVKSGQVLTSDMFLPKVIDSAGVPANATGNIVTTLASYSLHDSNNNPIQIREIGDENLGDTSSNSKSTPNTKYAYYVLINNVKYDIYKTVDGNEQQAIYDEKDPLATGLKPTDVVYYKEDNNRKIIKIANNAVIAKVDLNANTVITGKMINRSSEAQTDDVRQQEYNMLVLPTDVVTDDYVDIRLLLPTGQDYIVVSKKRITVPMVGGEYSSNTIQMNMAEEEILAMSNAIVEAYTIEGSKLYVTKYTEAGIQEAAIPTYITSQAVRNLIQADPNIVETAKSALISRYNSGNRTLIQRRDEGIDPLITEEGKENVKTKVEESITSTQEARQQYLQSLNSQVPVTSN